MMEFLCVRLLLLLIFIFHHPMCVALSWRWSSTMMMGVAVKIRTIKRVFFVCLHTEIFCYNKLAEIIFFWNDCWLMSWMRDKRQELPAEFLINYWEDNCWWLVGVELELNIEIEVGSEFFCCDFFMKKNFNHFGVNFRWSRGGLKMMCPPLFKLIWFLILNC